MLAPAHKPSTLFKLRAGQCRWPLGERREPAQFFCGQPTVVTKSYCRECCERAYVPTRMR